MVSTARFDTVLKLLGTAAHVNTNPHEAVNALQLASKMLHRDGKALTDLRLATEEDDFDRDEGQPPVLDMMRRIEALENEVRSRLRNEERLASENIDLKAQIKKLLSSPRQIARDTKREAIMEAIAQPATTSTPEEVAARREEKREERIARGRATKIAKPKEPPKPRGFPWATDPSNYEKMVTMYLSGAGKVAITKALGIENLNSAQVHAATANGRPPSFLKAAVREEGPMDWAEAWLIGSSLFAKQRSWLGPTLQALGLEQAPSKGLSFDLNDHVTPESIAGLRARYRAQFGKVEGQSFTASDAEFEDAEPETSAAESAAKAQAEPEASIEPAAEATQTEAPVAETKDAEA